MNNTPKSRNIPLIDYYQNLQLEFLSYHIRKKIYRKDFSDNYDKICTGKREKILGIASKNLLPSIFSSNEYLKKYLDMIIPEWGIPDFQYKDKAVENKMKKWDIHYYFIKGTSVKFLDCDQIKTGIVIKNDKNSEVLEIYSHELDKSFYIHYSKVSRIFSQDFFKL